MESFGLLEGSRAVSRGPAMVNLPGQFQGHPAASGRPGRRPLLRDGKEWTKRQKVRNIKVEAKRTGSGWLSQSHRNKWKEVWACLQAAGLGHLGPI